MIRRITFLLFFFSFTAHAYLKKHNERPLQAESDLSALESWETPISEFFIRNHTEVPTVNQEKWIVEVGGLVENPLKLSLKDLEKFSSRTLHAVLECSGNGRGLQTPGVAGVQWVAGAVGNAEWSGVSLSEILKKAGVKPGAKFITVEGADKPPLPSTPQFIRSIPIAKAMEADTLLATKMNREEMPLLHGGPVRLILPRWYGQNWIKWVTRIQVSDKEHDGFFMKKAYRMPKRPVKPGEHWDSTTGTPPEELRVQSFVTSPTQAQWVSLGDVTISGKAFSGAGVITKTEVSLDRGKTWKLAEIEKPRASGGWQSFQFTYSAKKPGVQTVWTRATDSAGNVQPAKHTWNPPGYLRNAVFEGKFRVEKPRVVEDFQLYREKCLVCHEAGYVHTQPLNRAGWEKTVKKMAGFGAVLSPEEITRVSDFLARYAKKLPYPTAKTAMYSMERTRFDVAKTSGNESKGRDLYTANCAACHGDNGEGKIGPRLKGRGVPDDVFFTVVEKGLRSMPSFESLSREQVSDIRAFLANPS